MQRTPGFLQILQSVPHCFSQRHTILQDFTKWFGISKKGQKKLVCRDRESTLCDQSPQESLQRVFTGSPRRCIEMISKRNRNKLINIDMGFQ